MSVRQSLWATPYHPLRALLLLRGLYLLLACDLWFDMIEHGGRYGIGGFNVAHFALVDWLVPLPSPGLYVGLLIVCGFVSLTLATGPAPRWLRGLLAAGYTLAWMLSIHDSYQHHYLLSWLLAWCVALPDVDAEETLQGAPVRGWGFPMTAVTCAIVYAFTGISKSERIWRDGHVLRVLSHAKPPGHPQPGKFDAVRDALLSLGWSESASWRLLALSTIALQWAIAVGYLAAPRRDAREGRLLRVLTSVGLLGSIAFHAVAELFQVFEIGLFSYYMLWVGSVVLGPVWLLTPAGRACAALCRLRARLVTIEAGASPLALVRALAVVALLVLVGFVIPLPGALAAGVVLALIALVQILLVRRGSVPWSLEGLSLRTALCALAMWLALAQSAVPFDYYRRTAGELQRMGELPRALAMYRRAERYAPAGRSRADKIRELESQLERGEASD